MTDVITGVRRPPPFCAHAACGPAVAVPTPHEMGWIPSEPLGRSSRRDLPADRRARLVRVPALASRIVRPAAAAAGAASNPPMEFATLRVVARFVGTALLVSIVLAGCARAAD